jgi:hypothetical protein
MTERMSMNTWIFQGNPDKFNVDDYLQKSRKIYWSVTFPKHQRELAVGDHIYIWRAKGSQKAISGIVAYGIVDEQCKPRDEVNDSIALYDDLWAEPYQEASEIKAGIMIFDLRLSPNDGMLTSEVLKNDPIMSNLQILKSRVGSNFLLGKIHSNLIKDYWEAVRLPITDDHDPDFSSKEGAVRLALHKVRERNPKLRRKAIESFLEKNNRLFCEICKFSFEDTYGEIGKGFIEVHHLRPISEYEENEITQIDDLRLVCSNCHRIIHRDDRKSSFHYLKKIFS